ncbi:Crp/Fnr family transcriptional regulator [Sphingomonas crusticola]|uniref:Crp/Fnr family transcriptional regulator n=1 Tax=Sphingomonas crusticola TaxID=1697973 RepID=UPI000E27F1BF|nr:Crp/Fnr family transcriptional regulator [Sphingomonas crusticola]
MATNDDDIFGAAIAKLERLAKLDDQDRAAIRALPCDVRSVPANSVLVRNGEETTQCALLLGGFACRQRAAGDGGRQIVSFHLPGDIVDLQTVMLPRADHDVQTITPAKIGWMPTTALRALIRERPNVADALWCDTLIDGSIYREWVLNVGRRSARARIAHMLCEFAVRAAAGRSAPDRIQLPMTQNDIADATGLTPVHVNRMLQELDRMDVIVRDKRDIRITDWPALQRIADFDARYLHAVA